MRLKRLEAIGTARRIEPTRGNPACPCHLVPGHHTDTDSRETTGARSRRGLATLITHESLPLGCTPRTNRRAASQMVRRGHPIEDEPDTARVPRRTPTVQRENDAGPDCARPHSRYVGSLHRTRERLRPRHRRSPPRRSRAPFPVSSDRQRSPRRRHTKPVWRHVTAFRSPCAEIPLRCEPVGPWSNSKQTGDRERQADRRARPFRRRAFRTFRPPAVAIRARKPCFLARRRILGWKVRFTCLLRRVRKTRPGPEFADERRGDHPVARAYRRNRTWQI